MDILYIVEWTLRTASGDVSKTAMTVDTKLDLPEDLPLHEDDTLFSWRIRAKIAEGYSKWVTGWSASMRQLRTGVQ